MDESAPSLKPTAAPLPFTASQVEHIWDSMTAETQRHWSCLGWNRDNWDSGGADVWSESVYWADLPEDCQAAAQALGFCQASWDDEDYHSLDDGGSKHDVLHLLFECLVKLNLEVFGAGGAVWGWSEVVGLRTAENKDGWQVTALVVGFVIFLRWMCYIYQHVHRKRLYVITHRKTTQNIMRAQTRKRSVRRAFRSAVIAAKAAMHLRDTARRTDLGLNIV